jgi:N-acetylneuraminate synthase
MQNKKVFIIAEAGVNHNGNLKTALKMVDAAVTAKVDAVKFQVFVPQLLVSHKAKKAQYQKKFTLDSANNQLEMLKKLALSKDEFITIKNYCDKKKIIFLATPFDFESADFIQNMVAIYKISSTDLNNFLFLEHIAKKNKPIILSTGMSTLNEVARAVNVIRKYQKCPKTVFAPLSLLHCTSSYPCEFIDANLRVITIFRKRFRLPVGYSDHTLGIDTAIAAVALGAAIVEKHFTLDKNMPGPDHNCSLSPQELKQLVNSIRNIEYAMGLPDKKPTAAELQMMKTARKSLIVNKNLKKGDTIQKEVISIKRPGIGIAASDYAKVMGRKLKTDKRADSILKWSDLS